MKLRGIRNALFVTEDGVIEGSAVIEEGRIAAIGKDSLAPRADTFDAGGRYVLPGLVDPEIHLGSNYALDDDFRTETRAAVAAGVTTANLQQTTHTLFSHEQGRPAPDTSLVFSQVFPDAIEIGNQYSWIDFTISPLLMDLSQVDEIPKLAAEHGATSYKLYMHMKLGREALESAWPQAPLLGVKAFDDTLVYRAMEEVSAIPKGLLSIHCENWEIAQFRESRLRGAGRTDGGAWDDRSPDYLEAMHIAGYGVLAHHLGCPVHIQHVTSEASLEVLGWLRETYGHVAGQTAAHYLVLDRDAWKINTPIRGGSHRDSLWNALREGVVDAVGSDHVNRGVGREEMQKGNVWDDISGFPSRVEAHLPLLLSEGVNSGRLSLVELARISASNPARVWGLDDTKGKVAAGFDADFVVVDMDVTYNLLDAEVLSSTGWTAYAGHSMKGRPVATILRGELVFQRFGREVEFGSASGRYVNRGA